LIASGSISAQIDQFEVTNLGPDDGLPSSEVYKVHAAKNGYLWFLTDRGVCRYDGRNFKVYDVGSSGEYKPLYSINEDSFGNLWMCSYNGDTYIYKLKCDKIIKFSGSDILIQEIGKFIRKVYFHSDSKCTFIPTDSDKRPITFELGPSGIGATVVQTEIDVSKRYIYDEKVKCTKLSISISDEEYLVSKGNNLVSSNGKRISYDGKSGQFQFSPSWLSKISDMELDHELNLWVSTLGNGIYYIRKKVLVDFELSLQSELIDANDSCLLYTVENTLYVKSNKDSNSTKVSENCTYVSNFDQAGNVFFDVDSKNSYCYNLGSNLTKRLEIRPISDTFQGRFRLAKKLSQRSAQINSKKIITFPASGTGYYVLKYMKDTLVNLGLNYFQDMEKILCRITLGSEVLVGTYKGVWQISADESDRPRATQFLKELEIRDIEKLNESQCLLATRKGVILAEISTNETPKFKFIVKGDIQDLCKSEEYIWGIEEHQIFQLEKTNLYRNAFKKGLTLNSSYNSAFEKIYFYNHEVFVRFGDKIKTVKFDQLNHLVNPIVEVNFCDDTIFQPYENDISITYHSINYHRPLSNQYRYRLIGQDTGKWAYTDQEEILLLNTAHGSYTFEVMSRNIRNMWSLPARYHFTVLPRFHETKSFKALLVVMTFLLSGLGLFGYSRWRRRRSITDDAIKEYAFRLNHEKENSLRQQMNPHFVFNAVNSIQNRLIVNLSKAEENFLAKFTNLMRSSLLLSKEKAVPLSEELNFIKKYVEVELKERDLKVDVEFDIKTANPNNEFVPPLMIQPMIENAFKHAFLKNRDNYFLKIDISANWTHTPGHQHYLIVNIVDNGSGLNREKKKDDDNHLSMAVDATQQRLRIFNSGVPNPKGNIIFHETFPGHENPGTTVNLVMPVWLKGQIKNLTLRATDPLFDQ
jgi:two-component sensor histidine kinase